MSDWFHGTPSGNLKGGITGLHLGTLQAARDALYARIGVPVEGDWDGTREYGKTLLCGASSLKERGISQTGYNCGAPEGDFYPTQLPPPKFSDKTDVPWDAKPDIGKFKIVGPMTRTTHVDAHANGRMRSLLARGRAKRGYFYKNDAEDYGSVSAVVPGPGHVQRSESMNSVRKLIERFVPEDDDEWDLGGMGSGEPEPVENWEELVMQVVHQLQKWGYEVISDDNTRSVRLKFTDDPEGPATNLLTGEPAGIQISAPDSYDPDEDLHYITYEVYPKKNWSDFVKRCERRRVDWTSYSEERGGQFEQLLSKAGFEMGGVGGHPPNFDYGRTFGKDHVTFNFWGNPYHA
jgi:hypothetical protein